MKIPVFFLLFVFSSSTLAVGQEVTGFREEVYSEDKAVLKMRIYEPKGESVQDARPAIVFFFGGGWRNGTPKQFHTHCEVLKEHGFVAMAAEYRIKSKHDSTPLDSFEDAKSAIRWVRDNAERLGVDPGKIAAGGGSAGGHLAAATAVCESKHQTETRDTPDAVVAFNPALNLLFERVQEKWGEEVYATLEAISPLQNLNKKDHPPMIIFHGEADSIVPFETAAAYVARAEEIGVSPVPELVGYEGRDHGFFNYGRGDGKDYEDTVDRMLGFFRDLDWIE